MASITYNGYINYDKEINYAVLIKSSSSNISITFYKTWDGTLEYLSSNLNWTTINASDVVSSNNGKIYIRGTSNTYVCRDGSHYPFCSINTEGNVSISGQLSCLFDWQTVKYGGNITMAAHACDGLFYNNTKITDISELIFSETISAYCYANMFALCANLAYPPEILPATTLADFCYSGMFSGCSITTCPKLPATTLATRCYGTMFRFCMSLEQLPELPALNLVTSCYELMFSSCYNIKLSTTQTEEYQTPYRIPVTGTGTNIDGNGLLNMFNVTGGTFTGTPDINTTYYTSNEVVK